MFDISLGEMALVAVVAVVFIGPKELPTVIRAVGRGLGQLKRVSAELKGAFDDLAKESGLKETHSALEREARMIRGDDGEEYEAYDISDLTNLPPPEPKAPPHD